MTATLQSPAPAGPSRAPLVCGWCQAGAFLLIPGKPLARALVQAQLEGSSVVTSISVRPRPFFPSGSPTSLPRDCQAPSLAMFEGTPGLRVGSCVRGPPGPRAEPRQPIQTPPGFPGEWTLNPAFARTAFLGVSPGRRLLRGGEPAGLGRRRVTSRIRMMRVSARATDSCELGACGAACPGWGHQPPRRQFSPAEGCPRLSAVSTPCLWGKRALA